MSDMKSAATKGKPTQQLIDIAEIREGIVVLKDGTMRAVLMTSSLNFALKSQEEQDAIVYAYQDFINSLDFPIQMVISSRKADITPYLEQIRQRKERQHNELLRLQMEEYINFVSELVKNSNIMTKTFFIVVPFSVQQSRKEGFFSKLLKGFRSTTGTHVMTDEEFDHNKAQLFQRVEQVAVGLRGIGLRLVPLQTDELLELFYNLYNPTTSRNQRLKNSGELQVQESEG
jgi:hypothetical protein